MRFFRVALTACLVAAEYSNMVAGGNELPSARGWLKTPPAPQSGTEDSVRAKVLGSWGFAKWRAGEEGSISGKKESRSTRPAVGGGVATLNKLMTELKLLAGRLTGLLLYEACRESGGGLGLRAGVGTLKSTV